MSGPNPKAILKLVRRGYFSTKTAAAHLQINRITPYKWATANPPRVRSERHGRFLFVHLGDCEKVMKGVR